MGAGFRGYVQPGVVGYHATRVDGEERVRVVRQVLPSHLLAREKGGLAAPALYEIVDILVSIYQHSVPVVSSGTRDNAHQQPV